MLSEEQIENIAKKLFPEFGWGHPDDSEIRAKQDGFKAAFALLMPIIERQQEALNSHDCSFVFWLTRCHQCKALQETKKMLEQLIPD